MRFHDPSVRRTQVAAQVCGLVAMIISLLALVGWATGQVTLTQLRADFPPLPPNVACALLMLGVGMIALPARDLGGERIAAVCGGITIFMVVARVAEYVTGWPLAIDHLIFDLFGGRLGLPPVERLTLSPTVAFFCVGAGLLALGTAYRQRLYDVIGALLGVVTVVIGLAFLLGYVYGKPLGYGRETAPFSMSAAASFSLLGLGLIFIAVSHDAAERRASRRREAAQHSTTRVLLKFESLEDALPMLLRGICLSLHWPYASFWQFESGTQKLRCVAFWSEQTAPGMPHDPLAMRLREFGAANYGITLAPEDGLPGQACALGQPVWVADLSRTNLKADPLAAAAVKLGLRAAFAVPVMDGVRCLGVLESFHPRVKTPDDMLLATLTAIAGQVALFIRRRRMEASLRESEERTRLIIETANDAFVELDAAMRITRWNAEAEHIFGWSRDQVVGKSAELIIAPPNWQPCAEGIQRYLDTGVWRLQNRRVELSGLHRDGHTFPIELTAWPIHIGGNCRFNAFISDITARKEAERQIAARTNELQRDLHFAREFQEALLPRDYPRIPDGAAAAASRFRLNFHHLYQPTLSVSGDFFDVIQLSDHSAGVFIADVMGHGARSALVTAILRTLLQDLSEHANDPARFLAQMNDHFLDIIHRSTDLLFVSAFYLVLDVKSGEACYASAGHPSPLLAQRNTGEVVPLFRRLKGNPALGVRRNPEYQGFRRPLAVDDVYLLFTDGVIEAANAEGVEFGSGRFEQVVRENLRRDLRGLDDAVIQGMRQFIGNAPITDDVCLVAVEVSATSTVPATAVSGVRPLADSQVETSARA